MDIRNKLLHETLSDYNRELELYPEQNKSERSQYEVRDEEYVMRPVPAQYQALVEEVIRLRAEVAALSKERDAFV